MNRLAAIRLLAKSELDRFLDETISRLRWATIAALLLISLAQPLDGRTRFPDWMLVLGFASYNLIADLARRVSSGGAFLRLDCGAGPAGGRSALPQRR